MRLCLLIRGMLAVVLTFVVVSCADEECQKALISSNCDSLRKCYLRDEYWYNADGVKFDCDGSDCSGALIKAVAYCKTK
jgi:hypothetical protein